MYSHYSPSRLHSQCIFFTPSLHCYRSADAKPTISPNVRPNVHMMEKQESDNGTYRTTSGDDEDISDNNDNLKNRCSLRSRKLLSLTRKHRDISEDDDNYYYLYYIAPNEQLVNKKGEPQGVMLISALACTRKLIQNIIFIDDEGYIINPKNNEKYNIYYVLPNGFVVDHHGVSKKKIFLSQDGQLRHRKKKNLILKNSLPVGVDGRPFDLSYQQHPLFCVSQNGKLFANDGRKIKIVLYQAHAKQKLRKQDRHLSATSTESTFTDEERNESSHQNLSYPTTHKANPFEIALSSDTIERHRLRDDTRNINLVNGMTFSPRTEQQPLSTNEKHSECTPISTLSKSRQIEILRSYVRVLSSDLKTAKELLSKYPTLAYSYDRNNDVDTLAEIAVVLGSALVCTRSDHPGAKGQRMALKRLFRPGIHPLVDNFRKSLSLIDDLSVELRETGFRRERKHDFIKKHPMPSYIQPCLRRNVLEKKKRKKQRRDDTKTLIYTESDEDSTTTIESVWDRNELVCPCCFESCHLVSKQHTYCRHHVIGKSLDYTTPPRRRIYNISQAFPLWEKDAFRKFHVEALPTNLLIDVDKKHLHPPQSELDIPLEKPLNLPLKTQPRPRRNWTPKALNVLFNAPIPPLIATQQQATTSDIVQQTTENEYKKKMIREADISTKEIKKDIKLKIKQIKNFCEDYDPRSQYICYLKVELPNKKKKSLKIGEISFEKSAMRHEETLSADIYQAVVMKYQPEIMIWFLLSRISEGVPAEIGRTSLISLDNTYAADINHPWDFVNPKSRRVASIFFCIDSDQRSDHVEGELIKQDEKESLTETEIGQVEIESYNRAIKHTAEYRKAPEDVSPSKFETASEDVSPSKFETASIKSHNPPSSSQQLKPQLPFSSAGKQVEEPKAIVSTTFSPLLNQAAAIPNPLEFPRPSMPQKKISMSPPLLSKPLPKHLMQSAPATPVLKAVHGHPGPLISNKQKQLSKSILLPSKGVLLPAQSKTKFLKQSSLASKSRSELSKHVLVSTKSMHEPLKQTFLLPKPEFLKYVDLPFEPKSKLSKQISLTTTVKPWSLKQISSPTATKLEPLRQISLPTATKLEPLKQTSLPTASKVEPVRQVSLPTGTKPEPLKQISYTKLEPLKQISLPTASKVEPVRQVSLPTGTKPEPLKQILLPSQSKLEPSRRTQLPVKSKLEPKFIKKGLPSTKSQLEPSKQASLQAPLKLKLLKQSPPLKTSVLKKTVKESLESKKIRSSKSQLTENLTANDKSIPKTELALQDTLTKPVSHLVTSKREVSSTLETQLSPTTHHKFASKKQSGKTKELKRPPSKMKIPKSKTTK